MLRRASQGQPLRVVDDQVCTPSYTVDVAQATAELLGAGCEGLFHLTSAGSCSWHDFAREIFAQAGIEANLTPIRSSDYAAAARRPRYSVLDCSRAVAAGVKSLRPWPEAVGDYLRQRAQVRGS